MGKDFKSGGMILDFVLSKPFSKGEWNNTYTFDFEGHRFSKMEFVHELQNFYYSLAGVMLSLSITANVPNLKDSFLTDKMELQTAIEILEYHQEWRLGKRDAMTPEPKKLTEALDIVLSEVKKIRLGGVSPRADWVD